MSNSYTFSKILARRAFVIFVLILSAPVVLFRKDKAKFYSLMHKFWLKTSDKPVWLTESEKAGQPFI